MMPSKENLNMKPSITHIAEGPWGQATIYSERKKEVKISKDIIKDVGQVHSQSQVSKTSEDSYDKKGLVISAAGKSSYILPQLFSSMFATILEDSIIQMKILAESSNETKIIKAKSDWEFLERQKFGVKEGANLDIIDAIDPKNLNCVEFKINKLDNDRSLVTDVIKNTYLDLGLQKSFNALMDSVNAILAVMQYRKDIAEKENNNRILHRELFRQLRQLRNHIKLILYDMDVKIDTLRTEVADVALVSEARSRYSGGWQRARTEQHDETINGTEAALHDSINFYRWRTDQESRTHMEIEMLTRILITETLEKVEDIMTKYDVDMESIDLKIQIQKNDYQNMQEKRAGLEKIIEEHQKEMSSWVNFKDERERARQYRLKMTNAAFTVQAWWRGLLVRLQIGPYKPSKRRAPVGEGKGKKKK